MSYEVSKPFNGHYRVWSVGDACQASDDIGPHTHEDLAERGFLVVLPDPVTALPPPAAEPDLPDHLKPNVAHAAAINGGE